MHLVSEQIKPKYFYPHTTFCKLPPRFLLALVCQPHQWCHITRVSSSHSPGRNNDGQPATIDTTSCDLLTRLYSGVSSSVQLRPFTSWRPRWYFTCWWETENKWTWELGSVGVCVCLAELMFSWFCLTRSSSGVCPRLQAFSALCLYFTYRKDQILWLDIGRRNLLSVITLVLWCVAGYICVSSLS